MSPPEPGAPAPGAWAELGRFLGRDLLILEPVEREASLRQWREITEAEARIDDRLTVGLLGGTGVGKSTLVNALAGAAISAAGERRPTTSRVIAYRHCKTPLPAELPLADISEPQVVHERAALERVIVLDFPDFDSVEELHHEVLARFCPHLDALIVLADDMKYADDRLHELLHRLPQARENLRPVLNKVDRLEKRYPGRWREVAGEILDDFARKLEAHAGIRVERSSLLAISAQNACAGNGDSGDFPRLVRFLETYREEKRRRASRALPTP
jgi:GTP1/Obg family GTP-binding protein